MPAFAWLWKRCPSRSKSRGDHEHRDGTSMENVAERVVVDQMPELAFPARGDHDQVVGTLLDLVDDRRTRRAPADLRARVEAVADPGHDLVEAFMREPFELFLSREVGAGLRYRAKGAEVARWYGGRDPPPQRPAAGDLLRGQGRPGD